MAERDRQPRPSGESGLGDRFPFTLANGTVSEMVLSPATRAERARLCSTLNSNPIEKTSDLPHCLAENPLHRELIEAFHVHGAA